MSSGSPKRWPRNSPAFQTTGAKSASSSLSVLAAESSGRITLRAALVAIWSMCMIATSGPRPLETAEGSLV